MPLGSFSADEIERLRYGYPVLAMTQAAERERWLATLDERTRERDEALKELAKLREQRK